MKQLFLVLCSFWNITQEILVDTNISCEWNLMKHNQERQKKVVVGSCSRLYRQYFMYAKLCFLSQTFHSFNYYFFFKLRGYILFLDA